MKWNYAFANYMILQAQVTNVVLMSYANAVDADVALGGAIVGTLCLCWLAYYVNVIAPQP